MSSTKIALVIGHNEKNQGAFGSEGISEYYFNNQLLHDVLEELGFPKNMKLFYRDKDIREYSNQMIDLHNRLDNWGSEISIEFHFNSFSNESVQGHEVLYCSEGGKHIAELLNDSFDRHLPTSNRGIKKVATNDRGGGFCCRGKSLAIISEPFFSAFQFRFVGGGDLRKPLKDSMIEFLEDI